MEKWKQCTIADLGTVVTGKTPSTKIAEFWDGVVHFVTPKDIQGLKHITDTERRITEAGLQKVKGSALPPRAVCVSCIGNIGYTGMTTKYCVSNQQINSIVVNDDNDPDFVYYLMRSLWDFFKNYEGQSTTLSILNKTQFSKIAVSVPAKATQIRIAAVLSSLDEKIAANTRINDNLQQQTVTIFREWFATNPESEKWPLVTLDSLTSLISSGITPKYTDDSTQIVLNQKCIRDHYIDVSLGRRHKPKVVNEKWLQNGDLLINSTGEGTLGRAAQVWFVPENMTADSHITIVRPKNRLLLFYIGLWGISHEREIEALHTGSTGQTELPRERVKAMKLPLPDNDTLTRFNAVIEPLVSMVIANQQENVRLTDIRDSLLHKLMSGEIDVSNINI